MELLKILVGFTDLPGVVVVPDSEKVADLLHAALMLAVVLEQVKLDVFIEGFDPFLDFEIQAGLYFYVLVVLCAIEVILGAFERFFLRVLPVRLGLAFISFEELIMRIRQRISLGHLNLTLFHSFWFLFAVLIKESINDGIY